MESFNYKDELMAKVYREERMNEAKMARLIRKNGDRKSSRSNPISAILKLFGKRSQHRQISQKSFSLE